MHVYDIESFIMSLWECNEYEQYFNEKEMKALKICFIVYLY